MSTTWVTLLGTETCRTWVDGWRILRDTGAERPVVLCCCDTPEIAQLIYDAWLSEVAASDNE